MIDKNLIKRYEKIMLKWKNYKKLRKNHPEKCTVGNPDFLDWRERDEMFESLAFIIEFAKYD